ncbi:MAG: DUF2892 domain-containing protein [Pseudomonadota bacterium]
MWETNVGKLDRLLRVVAGVAMVAFAVFGPEEIAWKGVGYLGFFVATTGLLRTCPGYSILGLSTCSKKSA